jgi:hypothetical protein
MAACGVAAGTLSGAVVSTLVPVGRVHAANGLDTTATTTYALDFAAGVVRGSIEFSLVNSVPDRETENGVQSTFFAELPFGLPGDATNVTAVSPDGPLAVAVTPADNLQIVTVDFGTELDYEERLDMLVTFDLPGYAPRRALPLRANEAFISFVASAHGDPGRATVRIITPTAADVSMPELDNGSGPRPQVVMYGDITTYTFGSLTEPSEFGLFVTAADNSQLIDRRLQVDGRWFVVQAWPDDPVWSEFVARQIRRGVPLLGALIGRPLRGGSQLHLRESIRPGLEGYTGWFDYRTGVIELGEQLDPVVTIHELAHAWFNDDTSYHRWITEGLAETYANVVVEQTGGRPRPPERPDPDAPGRLPLNRWESFEFVQQDSQTERFGYAASFFVVDSLYDELGPGRMAEVLAAIDNATPAYRDSGTVRRRPIGWRRFLDVLEEIGGSGRASNLFRRYVVAPEDVGRLAERAEARTAYGQLVDRAGEWAPPAGVDRRMERWNFAGAGELMISAEQVVAERDRFTDVAADMGVELPAEYRTRFQRAARIEALVSLAEDISELGESLGIVVAADAATRAERSPLEILALGDGDLRAELDNARDAISSNEPAAAEEFARQVQSRLAVAESLGREQASTLADAALSRLTLVAAAAGAGLLLAGLAAVMARRRWRRRPSSGDVASHVDPGGDAPVDSDVEAGVGPRVDLDEDALAGASLGGVDRGLDVAAGDGGQGTGAAGVVERGPGLGDVSDAVLELGEDVGTVVDAQPVAGAEVLVDPDTHGGNER